MEHLLTKNEARLLQAVDRHHGSFLYELASAVRLTPTDAFTAAESLESRGYLALEPDRRFVTITGKGMAISEDISASWFGDPALSVRGAYVIGVDAAAKSLFAKVSYSDVSKAIDAELEKFK